jgi:UDPglucose--hexose-1-phosphate uridylyltransferase
MPTWEQRWHPPREEWVVVAAHRQNRPWTGGTLPGTHYAAPALAPIATR